MRFFLFGSTIICVKKNIFAVEQSMGGFSGKILILRKRRYMDIFDTNWITFKIAELAT
jgi:hypothetical protein